MKPEAHRYLACMTETKARLFNAHDIAVKCLSGQEIVIGDMEFGCLQLRKAIELIGFSGMIAEIDVYMSLRPKFGKEWRFSDILRTLNSISPNSFPFSIRKEASDKIGVKWHFVPQVNYAIEPEQLKDWHGRLNEHLHAKNPYSSSEDCRLACQRMKSNVIDILTLLENHCFLRSDHSGGFLVTLNARECTVTLAEFEATNGF